MNVHALMNLLEDVGENRPVIVKVLHTWLPGAEAEFRVTGIDYNPEDKTGPVLLLLEQEVNTT